MPLIDVTRTKVVLLLYLHTEMAGYLQAEYHEISLCNEKLDRLRYPLSSIDEWNSLNSRELL